MQPEFADTTTVLLIDDSQDTLDMLTDALSYSGMTVETASSGIQALRTVDQLRPDIILIDAMMPGMNGFETCVILKNEKGMEDVPVIFMTGFDETEHVVRALASGGVDFIAKPVPLDELFARIKVHLANARKARTARMALDKIGRRIVACDVNGRILWSTPQAGRLLSLSGLRADEGARLPWQVIEWLGRMITEAGSRDNVQQQHRTREGIEFRLLERPSDNEILLRLIDSNQGSDEERLSDAFGLTLREAEVLLWITHGKSNKEIAEILDMSPRTVNKHLEQIFDKLGIENRTAAATKAVRMLWKDS